METGCDVEEVDVAREKVMVSGLVALIEKVGKQGQGSEMHQAAVQG